jgi:hypothetical protein
MDRPWQQQSRRPSALVSGGVGVWGIIHAATENSKRSLRQDKWYYVWALDKESKAPVL